MRANKWRAPALGLLWERDAGGDKCDSAAEPGIEGESLKTEKATLAGRLFASH